MPPLVQAAAAIAPSPQPPDICFRAIAAEKTLRRILSDTLSPSRPTAQPSRHAA